MRASSQGFTLELLAGAYALEMVESSLQDTKVAGMTEGGGKTWGGTQGIHWKSESQMVRTSSWPFCSQCTLACSYIPSREWELPDKLLENLLEKKTYIGYCFWDFPTL